MINEGKRLHDIGLAIHWLKSNSKKPVDTGWTKGPRKPWKALAESYRYGLNMGVRLGRVSRFEDDTYLCVIDCDVKSEDPKHVKEMEAKLAELLKVPAPQVSSGRGNGSRHLYVRTREPVESGFRFSQSPDKVRVHMPSVGKKATPFERANLKPFEIAEGIRLRAAWEISVMGDGQQTVLPPSIHPDTGGTYEWVKALDDYTDMPVVDVGRSATRPVFDDTGPAFEPEDVDLVSSELPDSTVSLILEGAGCDDRSAALFMVTVAMVKARFTDNQILSVLTDQDTFLGGAAFEHANTNSRKRAAEWVRKYTLSKVKRELSLDTVFGSEVVEAELDPAKAEKQALALVSVPDWRLKIERAGNEPEGKPKSTLKNLILILSNEVSPELFKRDDFAQCNYYSQSAPWGGERGAEVSDIDLVRIKVWLAEKYRFEPPSMVILEAILSMADTNRFHPVREYLSTLKWDGKPRLDNWLETYLGATGLPEYLQAVGRKTLTAMVARVLQPGVKFDHVLVLEGRQGCGKSTAVRILSDPWFTDAMINIGDKDAVLAMRSAWIMELGELSSMRKADIDQLKQFISQPTDRIRLPYGKLTESFPRQCIFIGTTNSSEYLKDTTGNRRFWPVQVEQCNFKALERDRGQLLAEASFAWELGEPLYLEDEVIEAVATTEQGKRVFVDEWVNQLTAFFESKPENFPVDRFTISDLFGDWGPLSGWRDTRAEQMRAAEALRFMGYTKDRRAEKTSRRYFWVKK